MTAPDCRSIASELTTLFATCCSSYQLLPAAGGQVNLHMSLTQSEVDDQFAMAVPVFADFGKGMVRLGQLQIIGNSTRTGDVLLPARPKKVQLNAYKEILER